MALTYPLLQKRHILFRQRTEIGVDICLECVGIDLIRRFCIAEVLVRYCSRNEGAQVALGEMSYTEYFRLFFICHLVRDRTDMVYRRVIKGRRIRTEGLVLSYTGGGGRLV